MKISLKQTKMSLQAKNHNPSIITPQWMEDKKIIPEQIKTHETNISGSMIQTKNYLFLVSYEQFLLKVTKHQQLLDIYLDGFEHSEIGTDNLIKNIPEMFIKYINLLPEIPYIGVDIVHDFNVYSADVELEELFSPNHDRFTDMAPELKLGGFLQLDFMGYDTIIHFAPYKKDINVCFKYSLQSDDLKILRKKINMHYATMNFSRDVLSNLFHKFSAQ